VRKSLPRGLLPAALTIAGTLVPAASPSASGAVAGSQSTERALVAGPE
jgi:hypothetical protein